MKLSGGRQVVDLGGASRGSRFFLQPIYLFAYLFVFLHLLIYVLIYYLFIYLIICIYESINV